MLTWWVDRRSSSVASTPTAQSPRNLGIFVGLWRLCFRSFEFRPGGPPNGQLCSLTNIPSKPYWKIYTLQAKAYRPFSHKCRTIGNNQIMGDVVQEVYFFPLAWSRMFCLTFPACKHCLLNIIYDWSVVGFESLCMGFLKSGSIWGRNVSICSFKQQPQPIGNDPMTLKY